jgi:hypothetical protein
MDPREEIESILRARQEDRRQTNSTKQQFAASAQRNQQERERKEREVLAALQQIQTAFQPYVDVYQNGELKNPPKIELINGTSLHFKLTNNQHVNTLLEITYNDLYIKLSTDKPEDQSLRELSQTPYVIKTIQYWIEGHDKGGYKASKTLEEQWYSVNSALQKLKEELVTYVEHERIARAARRSTFLGRLIDDLTHG